MTKVCAATACPSEAPPKQRELVGDVKTPVGIIELTQAGFFSCDRPLLNGRALNAHFQQLEFGRFMDEDEDLKYSLSQNVEFCI